MSILELQKCFNNSSKETLIIGHTIIFNLLTQKGNYDSKLIISMFEKECYVKAKKYNSVYAVDRLKYDNETNLMIKMCEYVKRYYLSHHNEPNLLNDIINNSWEKAEQIKKLSMIGYISIQNNLPAGDPCWMSKMIGLYVM
jgi:hypothetical protein